MDTFSAAARGLFATALVTLSASQAFGDTAVIAIPQDSGWASLPDRSYDGYGKSLAIGDGLALVAAWEDDSAIGDSISDNVGVVYVYAELDGIWNQTDVIEPVVNQRRQRFGIDVAIRDGVAIVGASPQTGIPRADSRLGYAYVYEISPEGTVGRSTWLQPLQTAISDLGGAVAASDDMVVVAAHREDPGGVLNAGVVHVFESNGNQFLQTPAAVLTEATPKVNGRFGIGVGIAGDDILVTSDDSVSVFAKQDGDWLLQQEMPAPGGIWSATEMSAEGNVAVVGDRGSDVGADNAGAAFVYERGSDGLWSETTTLLSDDLVAGNFGYSVAVSGDLILVGDYADDTAEENAGAAHLFRRHGPGDWRHEAKYVVSNALDFTNFGFDVALWGDNALVGANRPVDPSRLATGAAYRFLVPEPSTMLLAGLAVLAGLGSQRRKTRRSSR